MEDVINYIITVILLQMRFSHHLYFSINYYFHSNLTSLCCFYFLSKDDYEQYHFCKTCRDHLLPSNYKSFFQSEFY